MRFNGVDIKSVHDAVSIKKEIPPGMPARDLRMIERARGELLAGVETKQDEYIVEVNIAGKNKQMAWEVRKLLAAWATSSGKETARLEPTHWPGVAYDAIVKAIDPPRFTFGFGVVDVIFALPEPVAYEIIPSFAAGSGSITLAIGGSWAAEPVVTFTADQDSDGVRLTVDGARFLAIKGAIETGDVIEADVKEGTLTINGEHAEERIIYTDTDWQADFSPGEKVLASNAGGQLGARWHNRWA